MWFAAKPIIDEHQLEWQIDTYKWLLDNYGQRFHNGTYVLVKPTKEHFPDACFSKEEVFYNTFIRVKQYAGVLDWPCRLEAQESDIESQIGPTLIVKNTPQGPAGTFRYKRSGEALITYNPDLVDDIEGLVSTYAHELGHYLTAHCQEPPPGGWDLWEPATDLTAVYMGFGIFMANSAFVFKQFTGVGTQGWSAQRRGYLTSDELLNALAIFVLLKQIPANEPIRFLKSSLRSRFKKVVKYLKNSQLIEQLASNASNLRVVQ